MLLQVVVRAICEAIELLLTEGPIIFKIYSALGIVSAVAVGNLQFMDLLGVEAYLVRECMNLLAKVLECDLLILWIDEILYLHLLEFAGAEKEIPRSYLVSESFAYLCQTKWKFGVE